MSINFAQDPKYCGFDEVIEQIDKINPGFKSSADFIYEIAKNHAKKNGSKNITYQILNHIQEVSQYSYYELHELHYP